MYTCSFVKLYKLLIGNLLSTWYEGTWIGGGGLFNCWPTKLDDRFPPPNFFACILLSNNEINCKPSFFDFSYSVATLEDSWQKFPIRAFFLIHKIDWKCKNTETTPNLWWESFCWISLVWFDGLHSVSKPNVQFGVAGSSHQWTVSW